jgi:hypothetical protein
MEGEAKNLSNEVRIGRLHIELSAASPEIKGILLENAEATVFRAKNVLVNDTNSRIYMLDKKIGEAYGKTEKLITQSIKMKNTREKRLMRKEIRLKEVTKIRKKIPGGHSLGIFARRIVQNFQNKSFPSLSLHHSRIRTIP